MDKTFDINGDFLKTLPTNKHQPSHHEQKYIDMLFNEQKNISTILILNELKSVVIVISLFFLFTIPQTDSFLQTYIPYTNTSRYALTIVKSILFAITLWLINNIHLLTTSY